MFSQFFIDRPIFASVLSIIVMIAGGVALMSLPLAQYPEITPPTVQVMCTYPGADAQVVAETVAAPIEQQVNGVEDMLYMFSQSTNDGQYNLTVTFRNGVDLNMAQVLVQNRVNLALPLLPDVIRKTGVTTKKKSPDILLAISLISEDGRFDQLYLSNYAYIQVRDEIARIEGVGDVSIFGERDYSMRIWVDPDKLASRSLTAGDVASAVSEQNAAVALGQVGQPPAPRGLTYQVPLTTVGRLVEADEFANIVLKTSPDGGIVRLKDVARVELGAKNIDVNARVNGMPSAALGVFQLPDANAFDTADRVRAKMAELANDFPEGLSYVIRYDTTPFIRESIAEVVKTLQHAVLLVALVVLIFLQNWRSSVIPLIAVPVAIIGTFAVMAAFQFSLNHLTLFGLVLAIGIVVDDAIVVVEAVERHIEEGLAPRDATIKAMEQVSGPVIAVGVVLSAVFVPCAFISGITGQFFRQFALTIAVSTLISTFNSLTLSPALAALLLKPLPKSGEGKQQPTKDEDAKPDPLPPLAYAALGGWLIWWLGADWVMSEFAGANGAVSRSAAWSTALLALPGLAVGWLLAKPLNKLLAAFFRAFNWGFDRVTKGYIQAVGWTLKHSGVMLLIYTALLGLTWIGFAGVPGQWLPERVRGTKLGSFSFGKGVPRGFIPDQDQGYLLVNVQLPDAASDERTQAVMAKVADIAQKTPGVKDTFAISGQSFVLSAFGSNFGSMFVILAPFDERHAPDLYGERIAATLRQKFNAEVHDAVVAVFGPPPVRGVGTAGGFKLMIEDRVDLGLENLQEITEMMTAAGKKNPNLTGMSSLFRANVPQLYADIDRQQCLSMNVPITDAFDTLQVYLGSRYVNDFNRFGRTWQVLVQADEQFRARVTDVKRLQVRNAAGTMVPMGSLAIVRETHGPLLLSRYNMYRASFINGSGKPGVSTGDAIAVMEKIAAENLPSGMAFEWTEMAFLEQQAGNTAMFVFAFSVVMVFLVLAALYESWSMPLAVILVVPLCLLSALVGVAIAEMDVNIFTQIGFVVLVGLASKNAILIVEYAKVQREQGTPRFEATLQACELRLRPILMTSFAFILGVLPLLLSHGAGAEMRRTLGTAVFSGMIGVTLFGIFLTPVFFYVIAGLSERRLFTSDFAKRAGPIGLAVVTLGLSWVIGRLRKRYASPSERLKM